MKRATIGQGFWFDRLAVNARQAIFHQWEQLEASGCIQNFRIAAGDADGWREGWFFADSDAYKWLDAAARIWASYPDERLGALMDQLIALLGRAQMPDGYLYTYNQIHFPDVRWQNLQIEHELYCHGHLIEAGVSHFESTGRSDLLEIARRAADRIVADFQGKGAAYTPGHEEIEVALLRLYEVLESPAGLPADFPAVTGQTHQHQAYLELARQFIEQRGRVRFFVRSIFQQNQAVAKRGKIIRQRKQEYLAAHPDFQPYRLPPGNRSEKPRFSMLRWYASALSGKYLQQHAPVREQITPVGHAVRFAYLETAVAKLARLTGDRTWIPTLQQTWERMVTRRMYVTGGLGSQPGIEGFGDDYDLVPEYAYAETCAALGSLFWNWEMAQLTGEARYSELFEWQLYNAAAVGMGLEGTTYLYNNPLACRGGVTRQAWYSVPCCPSNLSRTWADLGKYICSAEPGVVRVHQYISSVCELEISNVDGGSGTLRIELETGLPWEGWARLKLVDVPDEANDFEIQFRQPAWGGGMRACWRGEEVLSVIQAQSDAKEPTACGYDPRRAVFQVLRRDWTSGDTLEIEFEMPVQLRRAHPRVKGHQGKAAVTRGPLVYCLESVDNPGMDIFSERVDSRTVISEFDEALLGGIVALEGITLTGDRLTFIPYFLWGNRGPSQMAVWVKNV